MLVNKETLLKVQQKKVKKVGQVRYDKINQDILEVSEIIKAIDNIDNKKDYDTIPRYKIQIFSNKYPRKTRILIVTSIKKIEKINLHFKKWFDLGLI